jgi:hypothetical protein
MNEKTNGLEENDFFSRHQRKCTICDHPEREAIEEDFVHWHKVWRLARAYEIADYRSIYRHARATGLIHRRRLNFRSALDQIIENAASATVTADSVIRAIRASSCLDDSGRWTEPPKQVNFTVARTVHAAVPLEIPAAPPQSVPPEAAEQSHPPATISDEGYGVPSVARGNSTNEMAAPALASAASRGVAAQPRRQPSSPPAPVGFQPPNLIYGTGIRNEAKPLKTLDCDAF